MSCSCFLRLNIKVVGGQACTLEVDPEIPVSELKERIGFQLNMTVQQEKLVYKGKPLEDDRSLCSYNLPNDAKLFLMKSKESNSNAVPFLDTMCLTRELRRHFMKYFSESESERITREFMKDVSRSFERMSLDDWENLAARYVESQE